MRDKDILSLSQLMKVYQSELLILYATGDPPQQENRFIGFMTEKSRDKAVFLWERIDVMA